MEYIDHTGLIEEWKHNLDNASYEKNLNQDVNIPSVKKNIARNNKTEYWPTIVK